MSSSGEELAIVLEEVNFQKQWTICVQRNVFREYIHLFPDLNHGKTCFNYFRMTRCKFHSLLEWGIREAITEEKCIPDRREHCTMLLQVSTSIAHTSVVHMVRVERILIRCLMPMGLPFARMCAAAFEFIGTIFFRSVPFIRCRCMCTYLKLYFSFA